MIQVSLPSIGQNVRAIKQTTDKKVFVDLSYDAYGLGAEAVFRYVRTVADGVIMDSSHRNTVIYSKHGRGFPLITSRSKLPKSSVEAAAASNTTVTVKSISELNLLQGFGNSTTLVRVMLESSEEGLGLSEEELSFAYKQITENSSYNNVKLLGIIHNEPLDYPTYEEFKIRYQGIDICCYNQLDCTDIVILTSEIFGYPVNDCPRLYRTVSVKGNVLSRKSVEKDVLYITDLNLDKENLFVTVNGDLVEAFATYAGGAPYLSFWYPKHNPGVSSQVELCNPTSFAEFVSVIDSLSHEELFHLQRPIPSK